MNNFLAQVYETDHKALRELWRDLRWASFKLDYREISELIHIEIPYMYGDVVLQDYYSVETIGL
ncbi:hypothetical protein PP747_gp007 [Rhizobium phage RHph_Y38]|uniref:Uncharacterized protein n=2 Tax=Acanvirus TaxID=3044653 RepID=A0A7S5QX09_9CAUD|nr:hypothetical protein PP747_gp007 [Rhizobium phage RHph_Y38]YP_010658219.1 hypothetical protein PP749_gp008 [Rhizobium phage RHEph22]QIG67708.1 hypothetical protein EVB52_007 [Rhizobium phage RHph_Y38]QXV74681.1 hypothetical protein [Rhizobium phage RHEph22]